VDYVQGVLHNSSFQSSIRTSPFRVVYDRDPPSIRPTTAGDARVPAVQAQLKDRDEFLLEVRERLEQAQQQYKFYYDRKHREVSFDVGQWVWLRLIHRPLDSLDVRGAASLGQSSMDLFASGKRLVRWHTGYSFPSAPSYMMFFMSTSSSCSKGSLPQKRRHYRRFAMAGLVQNWRRCDVVGWHGDAGRCSCNGRVNLLQKRHGLIWRHFRRLIPLSSSRTSCWRMGERCHGGKAIYQEETREAKR
jgi:hypothetical protein